MSLLIPIKYSKRIYPKEIQPKIEELAGHFDKTAFNINPKMEYSLHTEYSFGKRKLNSEILKEFPNIKHSHKNFIPQLWKSKEWSQEFSLFIKKLVGDNKPPKIIEIHPPFTDYCKTFQNFLENYEVFENNILKCFPKVDILIENRYGTMYSGGKFLLTNAEDVISLVKSLNLSNLRLRIAFDVIQMFSAYNLTPKNINIRAIREILETLKVCVSKIRGIHIWGKKLNESGRLLSHIGNLNTYFNYNNNLKLVFLSELKEFLNDLNPRYFLPEVNSGNEDLKSITHDFISIGFKFI